jgi:hypothetical protein
MKTLHKLNLNETWLHGKYPAINAEINTSIPYVAIDDFYCQGDEADNIIADIHKIWTKGNCTVEQAILHYALMNGI